MDEKDEMIIEILKRNAKLSTHQISKQTGIPITTVHNRIKRLEKHGIIKNYTVNIDYEKLGKPISAVVMISLDHRLVKEASLSIKELVKKLKMIPGVFRAFIVTGPNDIMLRIRAKDISSLDRILTEEIRKIDGIDQTETLFVMYDTQ